MRSIVLGSEWALNSHFILQLFSPDFFPLDNQIRPLASLASPWPLTLKLKVDFGKDGVTHFLKISLPCGATEHCSSYFASLFTIISAFLQVRHSVQFSSIQFSCSVMSDSLWPHGLQHARPPYPSPTPRAYSNSCPLSRWCHPTISSSVIPFSSCPQSFPASGSFPMSQFFASGGQSTGISASTSVLPMNT